MEQCINVNFFRFNKTISTMHIDVHNLNLKKTLVTNNVALKLQEIPKVTNSTPKKSSETKTKGINY